MTSIAERSTNDADRLAIELEGSFRNRADLYRLIYQELSQEVGADEAEKILVRAIEKRGREVAKKSFDQFGPNDAQAIGEAFLSVSPDGGRMYPTDVSRCDGSIGFKVLRCPLKDAWVESGVADEHLATLCRIAGAFDRGLFESTGVRFDNQTWTPGDGARCCIIKLTNRDSD